MTKGSRPGRGARPPGRGTGGRSRPPGPPLKPPNLGGTGRGTTHKSSAGADAPVLGLAFAICLAIPLGAVIAVGVYLAHGYGLIG